MKKTFKGTLVLYLTILSLTISAQMEKQMRNSLVVGGTLSFSQETSKETQIIYFSPDNQQHIEVESKLRNSNFSPYFGAQINNNVLIGMSIEYQYQRRDIPSVVLSNGEFNVMYNVLETKGYSGSVFARYTFNPDNKFKFFTKSELGFLKLEREYLSFFEGNTESQDYDILFFDIGVGFLFEINDKYNVIANIGEVSYQVNAEKNSAYSNPDNIKYNILQAHFGLSSFQFGFERKF